MGRVASMLLPGFSSPIETECEALFGAIEKGDIRSLQELIDAGADLTQFNDDGFTALHAAAERGKKKKKNSD